MTTISAKIIADSVSPEGIRLTTMHLRYPRFIHSEFLTHRVFSRNARSSRAVPVKTMLREIETDPVIPLHWGANQKGMQADRECEASVGLPLRDGRAHEPTMGMSREKAWLKARDEAVRHARGFHEAGYHKQVVNRLLEPFMHIDTLVTATEWANFLALRDHPAAEPHIAMLALEIKAAMVASSPQARVPGQWHIPYRHAADRDALIQAGHPPDNFNLIKLSVARCARISYAPFDGEASIEAELRRYTQLVGAHPLHASPAEHQATPDQKCDPILCEIEDIGRWERENQHGNLRGWIQYRKTLPGENQMGAAA